MRPLWVNYYQLSYGYIVFRRLRNQEEFDCFSDYPDLDVLQVCGDAALISAPQTQESEVTVVVIAADFLTFTFEAVSGVRDNCRVAERVMVDLCRVMGKVLGSLSAKDCHAYEY